MPLASFRPQYVDNTLLLPISMEMNVTKISRVITQVNPVDCSGKDGFATTSCKRNSKQHLKECNFVNQEGKNENKCVKDRQSAKKVLDICIKPSNCNKQIYTTNSTALQNRRATNLNCKYLEFPNNNKNSRSSCNHDYMQTKYNENNNNVNNNNYNSKSHNSIISILYCKQFKAIQQQQHEQQQQVYKTHQYQKHEVIANPQLHTHKCSLNYTPKSLQHFQDLFYLLSTLILIFSLHLLPVATASCRYEPSRSCEAICRPIWSPPDNNNYQSTVLDTNNVTLENFFASDYNCTIRALVLMPDDDGYVASLKRVVPILQVAEQHIHASGLLPSYIQFDWMPQDDKCDAAFAAVKAMDGIVKNCSHVFFGPVCDYSLAAVGRIAKYFNSHGTPLISVGGSTFDFEKPKTKCSDEFYMLLRTGMLSFESISELTIAVMKRNKWSRSIFFYDADGQRNVAGQHTCYLMMTSLGKQMRNENMTFAQYRITEKLKNRTEEMTREIGNKNSGKW